MSSLDTVNKVRKASLIQNKHLFIVVLKSSSKLNRYRDKKIDDLALHAALPPFKFGKCMIHYINMNYLEVL